MDPAAPRSRQLAGRQGNADSHERHRAVSAATFGEALAPVAKAWSNGRTPTQRHRHAGGRGKGPARGTGLHPLCGAHGLAPVGTFERHACMHALPAASCVRRARGWCAGQPGQACDGIMPLAHLPCQPCDDLNVQGLISSSPSQQRHRHACMAAASAHTLPGRCACTSRVSVPVNCQHRQRDAGGGGGGRRRRRR